MRRRPRNEATTCAAIQLERAAHAAVGEEAAAARLASAAAVVRLATRLQAALGFAEAEAVVWRRGLGLLVPSAASGSWTREGRLLYDVQRVCIDQEREVYAVDVMEWLISWGRRPVVRLLPHQRQVNLVRRLRGAAHRLASVGLPEADRKDLLELLSRGRRPSRRTNAGPFSSASAHRAGRVGVAACNYVEHAARDKIIEELLDRIVDRGFLTIGDLRDALARNRLKLADLSVSEFFAGDALLRANRKLAVSLDGVYHRGEIYLRGLQRVSSLGFGTRVGRFLTLYLILPLLGAFVALKGCARDRRAGRAPSAPSSQGEAGRRRRHGGRAAPRAGVGGAVRRRRHARIRRMGAAPGAAQPDLIYDNSRLLTAHLARPRVPPRGVRRLPPALARRPRPLLRPARRVHAAAAGGAFFQSRTYLLFYLVVLKPLLWAAPVALVLHLFGADPWVTATASAAVFLAAEVLLHSRLGMHVEEACGDAALRGWRLFSRDMIPGLFGLILAFFRRLLDGVERLLYTVDEWLRFRSGDRRGSVAVKAVLGFAWFFVTYVIRFCVNLLVEPQINPIKHFPVVTVSHKLIFAFLVTPLTPVLFATMDPITAGLLLFVIQFGIPGIPGFLVWEFKENWRLYRANQPRDLRPQVAGGHGETVPRLLRPGFHAGTLPKLYARLRRIKGAGLGKRHEQLHHVEEAVRRFVERNLLAVLAGSKTWGERPRRTSAASTSPPTASAWSCAVRARGTPASTSTWRSTPAG